MGLTESDKLNFYPNLGISWEAFVIEQIRQKVQNRWNMYYYRTHDGTEADLVLCKGLKTEITIEIKYSSAPKTEKGLTVAIHDLKTKNNFIIVPQTPQGSYRLNEKITVCDLYEFLNDVLN